MCEFNDINRVKKNRPLEKKIVFFSKRKNKIIINCFSLTPIKII